MLFYSGKDFIPQQIDEHCSHDALGRKVLYFVLDEGVITLKFPNDEDKIDIYNDIERAFEEKGLWHCGMRPKLVALYHGRVLNYINMNRVVGIVWDMD